MKLRKLNSIRIGFYGGTNVADIDDTLWILGATRLSYTKV